MARGRTEQRLVTKWRGPTRSRVPDDIVVEEPLSIRLDDTLVSTTMRTPGHDFELAVGYCFTEGLLAGAPVTTCRYCATGSAIDTEFNVVSVETGGIAPVPAPRLSTTTSSCGWCGTEAIDDLSSRLHVRPARTPFRRETLLGIAEAVAPHQHLFMASGGVHAAAAFGGHGEPKVVREDIGRHNAVDKVVGRLVLDGNLPPWGDDAPAGLFVSGRASFELVQKAWAGGFDLLLAVSAPSSLAVEAAERAGLTLVGFARNDAFNVYSGAIDP